MQGLRGKLVKGDEPEAVYWKRRGIVAGAVLALILVVVLAAKAIGGGEDGRATAEGDAERAQSHRAWETPSIDTTLKRPSLPSESPSAAPSPSESSAEPVVPACAESDLMLQVVAAFDEVRAGSEVPVSVLVASGAADPCTVDLGQAGIEVAAGTDVVFASAHCETPAAEPVELEDGRGQTVEFTFDGLASDPGCAGDRRELPAGDYQLTATLGAAASPATALKLT